jgi:hypothetical protein
VGKHAVVHLELSAQDPRAMARFYRELFGWRIDDSMGEDYLQFQPEENPGGGFAKVDGEIYQPGDVIPYIHADDIDASLRKVEALGGKTVLGKTEIPGVGWYAFFKDPTGNRIGLYTSMRDATAP